MIIFPRAAHAEQVVNTYSANLLAVLDSDARLRFHGVEIDVGRREIRVQGAVAEVQPKVFDLLHYLIVHRDRVVDKAELMEVLWPGVVVTEASLTQALKKARKLVGDDGERQLIIRTVQRRGFRFVGAFESSEPPRSMPAPAAGSDTSVAVLPFVDMSPAQDQQYFCDGMAEEIINALTRVDGLRVAARTSSFAFKGKNADVREMARQLNVASVLEGSVRRSEDRIRVVAQLIDAHSGYQRWSERWDRPATDVFAIQDEISLRIAQALKEHVTQRDRAIISVARPKELSAYEVYLRGLQFFGRFGKRSQRFALEMFRRAIEIDANYAPAWAGIAMSHATLYQYAEATEEHRNRAAEAGERAVQLDPLSPEAFVAMGSARMLVPDFAAAEAAFARAEELNPHLFEAWYLHARACSTTGKHAQAAVLYERAARECPEDHEALNMAAQAYLNLGRPQEALRAARRSAVAVERAVALNPGDVRAWSLGACLLAYLGRTSEAREWARRSCELEPEEPYVWYNAACTYVHLNDVDQAFVHLERVDIGTMANCTWMENDAALNPLREHPRFKALMERARNCSAGAS